MKIYALFLVFATSFANGMEKCVEQMPVIYQQPNLGNLHADLKLSIINKFFEDKNTTEDIVSTLGTLRLVSKGFARVIDSNHMILLTKLSQRTDDDILMAASVSTIKQSREFLREHFPLSLQTDMDFFCSSVKNKVKTPADIVTHSFFINRAMELLIAGCKAGNALNNQFTLIHVINTCKRSLPVLDDRKSLYVSGHIQIAELLFKHQMLHSGHALVLRWLQRFGNTIHLAIKTENEKFIDLLRQSGASINAGDKYPKIVNLQYQRIPQVCDDTTYDIQDGMTPLDRLIQQVYDNAKWPDSNFCSNPNRGYLKRMAILLDKGGKSADDNNFFVLAETAYRNDFKALQLLLNAGMDSRVTDEIGNTLLHQAISGLILGFENWNIDMGDFVNNYTVPTLELLLKHDVNPDACNHNNDSALALFKQEIDELRDPDNAIEQAIIAPYEHIYGQLKSLFKKYGATISD